MGCNNQIVFFFFAWLFASSLTIMESVLRESGTVRFTNGLN